LKNSMLEQMKLDDVCLEPEDFKPLLEEDKGVPSAHDPEKKYFPYYDGKEWVCDGPDGPCTHYRMYKTPCRHILQKRFETMKELYNHFCEKVEYNRDLRDLDVQDFEDVITFVSCYRSDDINRIATVFLNLAVMRGQVSTDDFHDATNEQYANEKIVGVAVGSLKRNGYIKCIGYKKTKRRVAHGRPIGLYKITKDGFELLQESRVEKPLNI